MTRDAGKPDTTRSVHLSASAGSGKTRALKDRYLALLDELDGRGLASDQAVAITFTDKAAAEIKERVLQGLPEGMLKKIIRGRQDLRISTIHSFCMNLLKRYPLEAGLPPDFGVLDERDRAYKIERAIDDALEAADRTPGTMEPLRSYSSDDLVEILTFLLSLRGRLKRMEIDAGGPELLLAAVRRGMGTDRSTADVAALISSAAWRDAFMEMERVLRAQGVRYDEYRGPAHKAAADATDTGAALSALNALAPVYFTKAGEPLKRPSIARKDFSGKHRAAYESVFFAVRDGLAAVRDLLGRVRSGSAAVSLLQLYLGAEERYRRAKLREGLLDFDDLEIFAYRLLRNPESSDILYWLDRKILHFLVDEFQDTSDIQWAILDRLTEEIFSGLGADKPMRPTLFVVGDKKQSIYRFREANYRLIVNIRERMERMLPARMRDIRTLSANYRSVPEIVDTVNRVFNVLWKDEHEPSRADRQDHRGSVRLIELLPGRRETEGPAAGVTEAQVLANEAAGIIGRKTRIWKRTGDVWAEREAGYQDCAILIQSRTRLKEYEAALQAAGVPFRVVGGIGFYEEDEVQAVLNVLFFLWNRDDRLSLVAALSSPLFGLWHQEVLEICLGGDLLRALRQVRPDAAALMDDWSRYAHTEPLSLLIHRIIRDTGAYVRFGRRNPQAIFNLDKLLDTAREFDRRGYTTLQDFVEWVKTIRSTEQREPAADMNLPGYEGVVSIMTVHKAKGLEFPIVLLPGMNQQPRSVSNGPRAIIESSDGGVRIAVKDMADPVYRELWAREQEELRREHQRLLYVAMTRARDHLVMIGTRGDGAKTFKTNSWLSSLHEAIPAADAVGDAPLLIETASPDWNAAIRPAAAPVSPARGRQRREAPTPKDADAILWNLSPLPVSHAPAWKKATDVLGAGRELPPGPAGHRGGAIVSPLVRGSVFHRCLEEYAKTGAYDPARIAAEFPETAALGSAERAKFIADADAALGRVTGNPELAWIFRPQPAAWSELPFLERRGNEIISGIIDRIVVREERGYVIDYKAILIENEEELQTWIEHYRPQIRIYCEAAKALFRLQAVEGYLLFLDSARLARVV